jgi:hypothetical protein
MKIRVVAYVVLALLLSGCAYTIESRVSSMVNPQINAKAQPFNKYIMVPLMQGINPAKDRQYRRYAEILEKTLATNGFTKAATLEEAGIIVEIAYGIGDPKQYDYAMALPFYGQATGAGGSNTEGKFTAYANYGNFVTTTYTPAYGEAGAVFASGSDTTYTRFLHIEAIDLGKYRTEKKIVPVWTTTVSSTGQSRDLDTVFPYMASAASRYIAKDSGQVRTVRETRQKNP